MALRLGDILVEKRIITPQELEEALKEHQDKKEFLGQTLIRMGLVTERRMLQVLADQQGIAFVDLKNMEIDAAAIEKIPAKFAWHYKIMPVRLQGNILTIAVSNPFDVWPVDDLETNFGLRVEMVLAVSSDIEEMLKKHYGVGAETIERILSETDPQQDRTAMETREKVEDLNQSSGADASVVKLVNQIFQQAIQDRATDIHFERSRDDLILRYRVDGVLYDAQVSENIRYLYPAIVSRIKVMTNLDIVERRIPQDGRAKVRIGEKEYELRVSIIPTLHGENIVVRILPTLMLFSLDNLGMTGEERTILEKMLARPHGIIFVTGPTGSGKTTTLYACLSRLNTRDKKIITIEDPVEYELKNVSQIQVNPKVDLTFARALRSVLRHDPDIIMVGEVRDVETARITIQTALTGHLVFSTLHTNNAAGGVTRLLHMDIDPFLISSSAELFMAQRLVRAICPECKEKISVDESFRAEYPEAEGIEVFYRGRGCPRCKETGYLGRVGIYEMLVMTTAMRKMVLDRASSDQIMAAAVANGMRTLAQSGWARVKEGVTTPEEVRRVTAVEV